MSRCHRASMVAVAVAAVAPVVSCSGSGTHLKLHVDRQLTSIVEPQEVLVSGASPGARVAVQVISTDRVGTHWASTATYRADRRGDVDTATASSVAGSYRGVDPLGLLSSMRPNPSQPAVYSWDVGTPMPFRVTVSSAGRRATATFTRSLVPWAGPVQRIDDVTTFGFDGTYFAGKPTATRGTAVLELGGSEGGFPDPLLARVLAGDGYPTLGLAYFNAQGLPATLSHIPIDYFARATRWLRRQPGVRRVVVIGVSRGSEAAQLLAVHYPSLVQGVVASVPSNSAVCSLPNCDGPAWTLHGRPLPFTRQVDNTTPTDDPRAVIPVERIRGPMLLVCADQDQVWASCPYARAIDGRLAAHHDRWLHRLDEVVNADHYVGSLLPGEPVANPSAADEHGREKVWPILLHFLAGVKS